MVSKEMKEIRGSVCCCHMEPSARKIYQPASRQSLVLNLSSGLCFSSYSWRSLKCLSGGLACLSSVLYCRYPLWSRLLTSL